MSFYTPIPVRPTVCAASVVGLRTAEPVAQFVDAQRAAVGAASYQWSAVSVAPDDGVNVIKPNSIAPANPGRWLLIPAGGGGASAGWVDFDLTGVYAAAVVPGFFSPPFAVRVASTCDVVHLVRRTAGLAGSTALDVRRNGVSIYLAPGDRPVVTPADGDDYDALFPPTDPGQVVWAPGDKIEVVMLSAETFKIGPPPGPEGLRARVYYTIP